MVLPPLIVVLAVFVCSSEAARKCEGEAAFELKGELNLALLVHECQNADILPARTLANSAIWTTERLNFLERTGPLRLGLSVFKVCKEIDYLASLFGLFARDELLLGVLSDKRLSRTAEELARVLGVRHEVTTKYWSHLVKAAVKLLAALDLKENVTVVASSEDVMREFFRQSRKEWICVKRCVLLRFRFPHKCHLPNFQSHSGCLESTVTVDLKVDAKRYGEATLVEFTNTFFFTFPNHSELYSTMDIPKIQGAVVVFGERSDIKAFMNTSEFEEQLIFVPLDGSQITDVPDLSYIIQPYYPEYQSAYSKDASIITTPLLFEIADPIMNLAENVSDFIYHNCNDTTYKINCMRNKFFESERRAHTRHPNRMVDILKIGSLKRKFVYNIFRVENVTLQSDNVVQTFIKAFTYNMFYDLLFDLEANTEVNSSLTIPADPQSYMIQCSNFASQSNYSSRIQPKLRFRSEPWVFGFWVLSLLGMLFCISVFIFLTVRLFKKEVFEGNPFLTVLLLISLCFMYFSVLPFTVEGNSKTSEPVCIVRSLCLTLSFASAFSLMLGRSILLASVSKEIGFMSHIAGAVQSFMTLFIFGVQAALSIHVFGRCQEVYNGANFIYYLSYNIILLGLLICFCPLIVKSQRNYKEGKYFTIASVVIAVLWCCWIPLFVLLDPFWKDPILCFALVSTASIILGAVFIPRTYLITIAEARDKLTSALPSLATVTSTMEFYKNGTQQHVYDCVNVAAISALGGNGVDNNRFQCDLYSTPDMAEDNDYQFVRRTASINSDKITRF